MPRQPSSSTGRVQQKLRTRALLLKTAVKLVAAGKNPTVTEVADAADVSRRTAFRYFPTQEKLRADAALEGLRPMMASALGEPLPENASEPAIHERVDRLAENMQRLAIDNEMLLRTMIHQTVMSQSSTATRRRGTRRLEWIETALGPLRSRLSEREYSRLVSALAVCLGIEALIILRDICGLSENEAVEVSQWSARAILNQALQEYRAAPRKSAKRS